MDWVFTLAGIWILSYCITRVGFFAVLGALCAVQYRHGWRSAKDIPIPRKRGARIHPLPQDALGNWAVSMIPVIGGVVIACFLFYTWLFMCDVGRQLWNARLDQRHSTVLREERLLKLKDQLRIDAEREVDNISTTKEW